MRITVPTIISLTRLPLAGAFALTDHSIARAAILVAAGASDWLDGRLARVLGQDSPTGEVVDPIVDKIFALTTIVALFFDGTMRVWEPFVLLLRDIVITAGFLFALAARLPVRFRARTSGKVVTVLQVAAIFALTIGLPGTRAIIFVTGAASVWAIADYARSAATSLRRADGKAG